MSSHGLQPPLSPSASQQAAHLDALVYDDIMRVLAEKLKKKRARLLDVFKANDSSNGELSVQAEQLRTGLTDLGLKTSERDFQQLLARLDPEGTGEVMLKVLDKAVKVAERLPKPKRPHLQKRQGLTLEDREEFRQIFCLFKQLSQSRSADSDEPVLVDWNDTGAISVEELEQLLETLGMKFNPGELDVLVREIDVDGNGEIDFTEFCDTMAKKIQIDYSPEDVAKSFQAFARNAPEGMIRVSDLRKALKIHMHREMIDAEVDELLLHYRDCYVTLPGSDEEYFNYQDYIDLMTPMAEHGASSAD